MNRKITPAAIILAVSVAISLIVISFQKQGTHVCHYDGEKSRPIYEVNITLKDGDVMQFCSIYCAGAWFKENAAKADTVIVTDEITGEKLDASIAFFVESDVISVATTRNRIHAFKDEHHAQTHAKQYNGRNVVNPVNLSK
ncbi:hypothetical protein C4544_01910 [candidate division WS5 bacterium]|uniref:Uncharacterized protein n=1 Tax=candidate division WS5 bacterium TaxID=2093353 RepID=A0A419DFA0_9BACT|nr:MAG: hypothetical protein C4544_01910 [candidate division WS5 bacterium]